VKENTHETRFFPRLGADTIYLDRSNRWPDRLRVASGGLEPLQQATRRCIESRLVEVALGLALLLGIAVFLVNLGTDRLQQYSLLAEAFLEGRLDVRPDVSVYDEPTHHEGARYVPMGPAPAVLLVPFVAAGRALGFFFRQGYLSFLLTAAVLLVAFRLARRLGYAQEDAFWLGFACVFGSAFLGAAMIPISNFFAHVLVILLLLAALLEQAGRQRPLLVGTLLALVLATRFTAGVGLLYFLAAAFTAPAPVARRLREVALLCLPVAGAVAALLLYNFARFGDPLETGYATQAVPEPLQHAARSYGLTSVRHVLGNLYYMLLNPPLPVFAEGTVSVFTFPFFRPDPWGMSIFVTSPWLAYLFAIRRPDARIRLLLATAACVALPLLFAWSMGYAQYGYRFALDFLPFLWLAVAIGMKARFGGLTTGFKAWTLIAALLNAWLLGVMLVEAPG
jgi:hypothetical protein